MEIRDTIGLLLGLLLIATLINPLARHIRLPFAALLVLVGYVGAEIFTGLGMDTGLRAPLFGDLVFYVFLPILVFEAGYHIDLPQLLRNLPIVLIFALLLMPLSTLAVGALIYYGIGHNAGFPWVAGLLCGALLASTDPGAIAEPLRHLGVPERLLVLLEGESLFNDATTVVLFSLILALALSPDTAVSTADLFSRFAWLFVAGAVLGLAVGALTALLMRLVGDPVVQAGISLIGAYAAYIVADHWLSASAVTAVLFCAVLLGQIDRRSRNGPDFVNQLWYFLAYLGNALLFLLMGMTITMAMFTERWLAMLIGIGAVLLIRALVVYGLLGMHAVAATRFGGNPVPSGHRSILLWGGLRGAVTLALALSLPVEIPYWWTIQSIAFGVVLFGLFGQAPLALWGLTRKI